ncbi:TIGR03668 family PPOX class F420-dependent oxidoreductase [Nocardia speluncae]|uniref:TIGR03668 family PPOX class F420-dependent oxidoreductase n=1 Tax=Nocardia speluncae TaxID=419477 RepID=A0A846XE14_9NOCA|nr:TIGR03668 family PPOX class F420-dependent oxidoreductase [Nocardia speluncae]NKY34182.1 TIGR03668 family PPOX class F420-dependent oxidoreductase [Nocardia speluncae]
MNEGQARDRFAGARVARLATVTPEGRPHLVPIVFAVTGDIVYTAVDAKPKSTTALRRLANIDANPEVAVLTDFYDEDWTRLWWVRAEAVASIVTGESARTGIERLTVRYPVYQKEPPPGPVLALEVTRWSGWSAGPI